MRRGGVALAGMLLWALVVALAPPGEAAPAGTPFVFTAAGDYAADLQTTAVLRSIGPSGSELHLALGDLSYGFLRPESVWCDYVKSQVGATFPFEVISGNHDDDEPAGYNITGFAQCLPHRAGSLTGKYGRHYYFDYEGLARFILISPNLTIDGTTFSYKAGTWRYNWVASAIDGARAAGLPWVIVGMHEVCITIGVKPCGIGTDLLNLLVAKRVDLVLQAHEHTYQRSKQLALGAGCPGVPKGSMDPACLADDGADGQYAKGAGAIVAIVGTGGQTLYPVNPGDREAGYFARWMGANVSPSWGILRVAVSQTELVADFLPAVGSFTDRFVVLGSASQPLSVSAGPPIFGNPGEPLSFLGAAWGGAPPYSYAWAFGDETSASGTLNPSHSYPGGGSFPVTLTVADTLGHSASATTKAILFFPGVYTKVRTQYAVPTGMIRNKGIVGLEMEPKWRDVEPEQDSYVWADIDARMNEAKANKFKVIISVIASSVYAPDWIKNDPRVQTITLLDPSTCRYETVPVYWDPVFRERKRKLIEALGQHLVTGHPEWDGTLLGIEVGAANYQWNQMEVPHAKGTYCGTSIDQVAQWLGAGYRTTEMQALGQDLFNTAAQFFPAHAIRFGYRVTHQDLDRTATSLAQRFLAYGHGGSYRSRFHSEIDFLSTGTPLASDPSVTGALSGQWNYLYKLLSVYSRNVGLKMVDSATTGPTTGCRLNDGQDCTDTRAVLQRAIDIGLSYDPSYLTVRREDGVNPLFADIFENTTRALGGQLRP